MNKEPSEEKDLLGDPPYIELKKWNIHLATWQFAQQYRQLCTDPKHAHFQQQTLHTLSDISRVSNDLDAALAALQPFTKEQGHGLKLSMSEAMANGMRGRHRDGTPAKPERYHPAHVHYGVVHPEGATPKFSLMVEDEGRCFDPRFIPNPIALKNLEKPNGRGVYLMGYYLCVNDKSKVGANIVYFPIDERAETEHFLTRELLIEVPLEREDALEKFQKYLQERASK